MEDERRYDPLLTGRAASSPDAWLRARTALAAGRLRDPDASPYLPVFLLDPDPSVRRAAAFGAGLSGDRRLVRFLVKALADPDAETAANAAEALGKLGGDDAVSALLSTLARPEGPRAPAAMALYRFPDKRVVTALMTTLEEKQLSPETKRAVVYALARRPQPEAAASFREVLQRGTGEGTSRDFDAETVAYAARALGLLRDEQSLPDLTELAASTNASVAVQALLSLERIGVVSGGGSLPRSTRAAGLARASDATPGVAVAALRLLGRFPGEPDVVARLEAERLKKGWKGQTALVSLARVDASRAEKAIAELLRDWLSAEKTGAGSQELKLGAVDALEYLSKKAAEDSLEILVRDPNARVRAAAVSYLSKTGGDRRDNALAVALRDRDPAVRAAALEASAPLLDGSSLLVSSSSPSSSASPSSSSSSSSRAPLARAWARAFTDSFREKEPDRIVSALDAAAALKNGGRELLLAHANDREAVAREKARRLLVEKFDAAPADFEPMRVSTRFVLADYEAFARTALASQFSAEVATARGSFAIGLDVEEAPLTVLNFVTLARKGFFDGGRLHRVVPDFVVQGGDPRGDGTGGPGYAIRDEINPLRYGRGAVGMALSGPDTGGSQWFVTLSPQPHLDGSYTVFGRVTAGMDVVERIEQDDALVSVRITEQPRPSPPPGALP